MGTRTLLGTSATLLVTGALLVVTSATLLGTSASLVVTSTYTILYTLATWSKQVNRLHFLSVCLSSICSLSSQQSLPTGRVLKLLRIFWSLPPVDRALEPSFPIRLDPKQAEVGRREWLVATGVTKPKEYKTERA